MGYIFWRDNGNGMEAAGPLAKNIGLREQKLCEPSWALV